MAIGKFSLIELMDSFSSKYKKIIEDVENHMQYENLLSDDYIVTRNEDTDFYGPARTSFESEDIIIEIFIFRLERVIKILIDYWYKNTNQFNNISQDNILDIFPEFVLTHELIHVCQIKRMGLDNYRLLITTLEIDVNNKAYRSYERCADEIAKLIIISRHDEIGRQVADIGIRWHRNELFL